MQRAGRSRLTRKRTLEEPGTGDGSPAKRKAGASPLKAGPSAEPSAPTVRPSTAKGDPVSALFDYDSFLSAQDYKTQFDRAAELFEGLEKLADGLQYILIECLGFKFLAVTRTKVAILLADVCVTRYFTQPVEKNFAKRKLAASPSMAKKLIRELFKQDDIRDNDYTLVVPTTSRMGTNAVRDADAHCQSLIVWREQPDGNKKFRVRTYDPNVKETAKVGPIIKEMISGKECLGIVDEKCEILNGTNREMECFPLNYKFLVDCVIGKKKPRKVSPCSVWYTRSKKLEYLKKK